ncbi:ABC transporter permease [Spirillospora sp. NPDC127200]
MRAARLLLRVVPVPAALALWELLARRAENIDYPPPSEIASMARELWFSGPASQLWLTEAAKADFPGSVARLLAAWAAAGLVGTALGVALGRSARLYGYVRPLIHFGYAIPPIMLLPFFIALFEGGAQMQLATILFGIVWPVLLNATEGARAVDRQYLDTAAAFRLSAGQRLGRVILPAAAPKIFAGMRISLSLALILMVVSEMVGATSGIGFQLLQQQRNFNNAGLWSGVVLLGVLGLALNTLFQLTERRVLAWHRGAGGVS